VIDSNIDSQVERTRNRPVTRGAISEREALLVAAVLAVAAFGLVLRTNGSTIALSFFALVITIFYPFAKRFISLPQAILGLAFSFGIPMAFSAVLGHTMPVAWILVLANLFWVLAYDTQYAMVDRKDDLKIGIRTSAITFGQHDVMAVAICYGMHLLLLAVAAKYIGLRWAFAGAWCVAAYQSFNLVMMIRGRSRKACYNAFKLNHWIGAVLFAGVVLDGLFVKI
jgi:4-hydroxybenzoate polyprenyltransferase